MSTTAAFSFVAAINYVPVLDGLASARATQPGSQGTRWSAPRRDAGLALTILWRSDQIGSGAELLYPIDVQFSSVGLLVFDHGAKQIKAVDGASGRHRFVAGRGGSGPGEFSGPVTFLGTWAQPMAVEFSVGRLTQVVRTGELRDVRVSHTSRWATGCTWGRDAILFQAAGHRTHDYFVSTTGESAKTIDSLAMPWPRLLPLGFMARQAPLRQLDDSTCAMMPLYNREFGLFSRGEEPRLGTHVEELPPARSREASSGKMRVESVAPGAKPGGVDVRAWRDAILVLFAGQGRQRFRTLDIYSRNDLSYRGSVALPFEGTRIAVRGDTLAIVGEDDFSPVVAVFLLRPRER